MRNTGWYIPYWRKPTRKKGKAERSGANNPGGAGDSGSAEEVWRNDEQLDAVRQRWVERYRRTARALRALNLSVGSDRAEVQARYDTLRTQGRATREVEDAYRHLQRALPSGERRSRRRPQPAEAHDAQPYARATVSTLDVRETVITTDAGDEIVSVDLYAGEAGIDLYADEVDTEPGAADSFASPPDEDEDLADEDLPGGGE